MSVSRQTILQKGAEIVRQKGFHSTGLNEILKAAGVPKGSFYFHFESKEAFGLELVDVYSDFMMSQMESRMSDVTKSGLDRLRSFFEFTKTMFADEDFVGGCPLGNLALEMGDINEKFRAKLAAGLNAMQTQIENALQAAQSQGEIPQHLNIKSTAYFILNSWEGALVRMKVEKSLASLQLLEDMIFTKILV